MLFSFQGKIWAGDRLSNGKMGKPDWVGNASSLKMAMQTETSEKTESYSGNRLQIGRLQKGKSANLTLTLDEWLPVSLALALWSQKLDVIGASVTGETFQTGLVAGNFVKLDNPYVSSIVLTDSTGSPLTLALNTNYTVESVNAGLIKIVNPGAFVQPFKAAYTYAARDNFALFTVASPERYLLLDGINTETGNPVTAELYRCRFDPVTDLDLIHDEYGNFQLNGSVLYDVTNAANSNLGGFGRFTNKSTGA